MAEQPRRVVQVGVVTSTKMQKTIKVLVERRRQHPRYRKYRRERTTYLAHDERNLAREGDWVEIIESRPLSKRKRWRLLRVLVGRGAPGESPPPDESGVQEPASGDAEALVAPVEEAVPGPGQTGEQL